MGTDTRERKATKPNQAGAPPPEPEQLPCPRCDSTNTKFCYYNNYNFSQPRHFCKSCRRYWTHGGTLRDIPVGGGSRKNAKRSRTRLASTAGGGGGASVYSSVRHEYHHLPAGASPAIFPIGADHGGSVPLIGDTKTSGSFTSLLNGGAGTGFLPLGGFGFGLGIGLDDVGFGLGRGFWPITSAMVGGPTSGNSNSYTVAGDTWQLDNGESAFSGSEDFVALPDLAISTPGDSSK